MPDRRAGMHEAAEFEARFAAALLRYAEQIPTEVDAGAVSQSIARAHPRHPGVTGLRPRRLIPVSPFVRWLVLLVVIALLLASLMSVGQRLLELKSTPLLTVHVSCQVAKPGWTFQASSATLTEDRQLSCRATSSDARLTGPLTLTGEEIKPASGGGSPTAPAPVTTSAEATLTGPGHIWRGSFSSHRGPNGLEAADLALRADDLELEVTLRMISRNGLEWSAVGQVRTLPHG